MSITKSKSDDRKSVFINIKGRFDYQNTKEFCESCSDEGSQAGITYFINLSEVSFIDSSALSILLLLRDYAKNRKGKVILDRPGEQMYQMLKVANFEKVLTINNSKVRPVHLKLVQ